ALPRSNARGETLMKRLAPIVAAAVLLPHAASSQGETEPYRDRTLPVDVRVADLLARMTLEEKVAQLQGLWIKKTTIQDDQANFSPEKAKDVMPHGLGQLSRPSESSPPSSAGRPKAREPRAHAEYVNAIQKWARENTRLGIPVMFHEEALHGLAAPKGTHFPVPMALASTWDPALVEKLMSAAAVEARARGCQAALSPVLDRARDPRWGRTEETYGEDPYLVSRLGVAAIRGYQGTSRTLARDKVLATAKHFAGHGPHEGGINTAPTNFAERLLRAQYLFPFETVITEGPVMAVMPSYNELDGVPAHKNRWLLDRLLRQEWGVQGGVGSGFYAVEQVKGQHRGAG